MAVDNQNNKFNAFFSPFSVDNPNRVVITNNQGYAIASDVTYQQLIAVISGGGTLMGADNGLHVVGSVVKLGGLLSEDTTINLGGRSLILGGNVVTSGTFYDVLTRNPYNGAIEKKTIVPEGARFDYTLTPIYAWGDSLTAGAGGISYPIQLTTITNFSLTNKGVGGDTSTQIKNRLVADSANYSKSVIIWAGRNNYNDPATVKADIATMISTIGHTRYLVLSILNGDYGGYERIGGDGYNMITQLNNDLGAIYGEKYIDIRKLLVNAHNQTTQDLQDFVDDIVPTSLRSDQLHLNTVGYGKVAEFVNQRLGWLYNYNGYLQSKDVPYYTIQNRATTAQSANFNILGNGIATGFTSRSDLSTSHYVLQNASISRFGLGLVGAESTGNLGSDFILSSFNDGGTLLSGIVFKASRASGNITINGSVDSGFKLDVIGSLRINNSVVNLPLLPANASTDFVLSIDGSSNVRKGGALSSTFILNSGSLQSPATFNLSGTGILSNVITRIGIANNHHMLQTLGSNRFSLGLVTAEGGSNSGSDFIISRYNDAGGVIDNILTIQRSTGTVSMIGGAEVLKVGTNTGNPDNAFIGFYPRTATPTTRSGRIGYTSAGNTGLAIVNDISGGQLTLATTGTTNINSQTNSWIQSITNSGNTEIARISSGTVASFPNTNILWMQSYFSSHSLGSEIRLNNGNGTITSPTPTTSGNGLGLISLGGQSTTTTSALYNSLAIKGVATENWSATAGGSRLEFYTTPNTTLTQTLRLTLDQDGSLVHTGNRTGTPVNGIGVDTNGKIVNLDSSTLSGSVTTTTATVTTIATIATVSNQVYLIYAPVLARRTDVNGEIATYPFYVTVKNIGGTLTVSSSSFSPAATEDDANYNVSATTSGTNILIQVTGVVGKTINWSIKNGEIKSL